MIVLLLAAWIGLSVVIFVALCWWDARAAARELDPRPGYIFGRRR